MGANNPQTIRLIDHINSSDNGTYYEILGWIDNDRSKVDKEIFGYKVLGTFEILKEDVYKECYLVNNITTNANVRDESIKQVRAYNLPFESLIHPSVNTELVAIGNGCIIHENVVLEAGVNVEDFSVISSGSIICHETKIGKCSFISSGVKIAGLVDVQECVTIYLGALITPRVVLEAGSIISAGSVVFENVAKNTKVLGNPAKKISDVISDKQIGSAGTTEEKLEELFSREFKSLLNLKKNEYFADYDLLPSFEMLRLITFLEEEFQIKILDNEIDEMNLGSFENIITYINNKNSL